MEEETLSSKIAFNGEILNVRVDEIRLPGGRKSTREIIEHSDAVAVVPIDRNGNMILVRQYRRGAAKDLLEIPAGCVEPGENPEETVKRELQEEIGYLPNKITSMGGFYASPGYNTEYLYLYLATELVPAKLHAEDTDSIEVVPVPIKSITDYIKSGKICDAKSVAGILYYMFMR
ncbi:MAG: NUDIX hydrolase [Dehalococcoidales bacterium]|nr:NUDIX hydrolase [Dehalococcoidales bacterium]